MKTTEGAGKGSGDPVLDKAFSEFSSEGVTLDEPIGESLPDPASQAGTDASADTTTAAPGKATGDDGSGKAVEGAQEQVPAATGAPASDDPYAGTEPFTYTGPNGETKTLDGVFRVPGEGLLVPEDKVSVLQELAERADVLDRVARDHESQTADYERLAEWRTTGADGKEQIFSGRDGLVEMRVGFQKLAAVVQTLDALFDDPQKFQELVGVNDKGEIVPDARAIQHLQTDIRLAQANAEQSARKEIGTLERQATSSPAPDFMAEAPRIIDWAAKSSGVDAKALTKEDRQYLSEQMDRYVRTVTEADRKANSALKLGGPIIDAKFTALVKHTASLRLESSKQAIAAEKAGKFNAGQAKGRQPVAQPTKSPAPVIPVAEQGRPKKADWDSPLQTALEEMNISR